MLYPALAINLGIRAGLFYMYVHIMPMNFHLMHHWFVTCSKHMCINKNVVVFSSQLVGEACQLGCPKIVLDHVCVYITIIYIFVIIYKALVHTQPSIVLLPGIHTTVYIL